MRPGATASPNKMAQQQQQQEQRELERDFRRVCVEFDELARDLYRALELDALMGALIERHRAFIERVKFEFPAEVRDKLTAGKNNNSNNNDLAADGPYIIESLLDDLKLLNGPVATERPADDESESTHANSDQDGGERHRLLADVFRRAGQAAYHRAALRKCRLEALGDEDTRAPLSWAQLALRHNAHNFDACYWYMISVGRFSETPSLSARERVLTGESFKRAILRCLRMRQNDPLAHHLLGRYYYHVGQLNWVQRTICKSLFNFELEGSLELAERELLCAHSLRDDWAPVGLWMARVLLAQGRARSEVRHWVQLGLTLPIREPSTELERRELLALARKLKMDDLCD